MNKDQEKRLIEQKETITKPKEVKEKTLDKFETDKLKGYRKSEEEKEITKNKTYEYINEYNKKNYCKMTMAITPMHKAMVETQAQMSSMSVSGYLKHLVEEDKKNFDKDEYKKLYNEIYENIINQKNIKTAKKKKKEAIDKIIADNLKNWKIDRIPKTSLAILRISCAQLIYMSDDIPQKVVINEAVELAKKYGADDDYSFVNGILRSISDSLNRE